MPAATASIGAGERRRWTWEAALGVRDNGVGRGHTWSGGSGERSWRCGADASDDAAAYGHERRRRCGRRRGARARGAVAAVAVRFGERKTS